MFNFKYYKIIIITAILVVNATGCNKERKQTNIKEMQPTVTKEIEKIGGKIQDRNREIANDKEFWSKDKWIDVNNLQEPLKYSDSQVVIDFLEFAHTHYGSNEEEIKMYLGQPMRYIKGDHESVLVYDGIYVISFKDPTHNYINFIAIKDAKYELPMGIKIGVSTEKDICTMLGEPPYSIEDCFIYPVDLVATNAFISLYLTNGFVSKITWDYGMI